MIIKRMRIGLDFQLSTPHLDLDKDVQILFDIKSKKPK